MTGSALLTLLLAGATLFGAGNLGAASRRANRVDAGEALVLLAVALGSIAFVCLAIRFGSRIHRQRRRSSHALLFRDLCRTHGLDHRTRGLLKAVARQHHLAEAARLFTEPRWLEPDSLPGPLRRRAAEVTRLRDRLFA